MAVDAKQIAAAVEKVAPKKDGAKNGSKPAAAKPQAAKPQAAKPQAAKPAAKKGRALKPRFAVEWTDKQGAFTRVIVVGLPGQPGPAKTVATKLAAQMKSQKMKDVELFTMQNGDWKQI